MGVSPEPATLEEIKASRDFQTSGISAITLDIVRALVSVLLIYFLNERVSNRKRGIADK